MSVAVSEAKLLEGKILAARIQDEIRQALQEFSSRGLETPCLAALAVNVDSAGDWYLSQQEKMAAKLGIRFIKPFTPADFKDQIALEKNIRNINQNPEIHGIFITMPLPKGFDSDRALLAMEPLKDVEGIHPVNLGLIVLRKTKLIPSTAFAAFRLLESTGMEIKGMKAVIAGQSAIVGRPLQLLLGERRVTTTVCNTGTRPADLEKAVRESDIVIACAGSPGLIKGDWIKPQAVVIDVGTTEVNGKLTGDVEFEAARKKASYITPVPGGVGPLTVTMLMQNLINAYRWQKGL